MYPGIQLFSEGINFGVIAQNLEGRILRKVMLKGIQENIFTQPIHDAVATELESAGVPENIAADIVGHDKATMTYGLYSGGTSTEQKFDAVKSIEYKK